MHQSYLLLCGMLLPLFAGAHCTLNVLPIAALAPDKRNVYIGKRGDIEVRFINEKEGEPTVFPEPPMTIRNLASGSHCEVDGGIWLRSAIYLSADGKTLMAQEYSGASDQLNFYDTRTCRKTALLDVSNAKWHLDKNTLQVLRQNSKAKSFPLNHSCTITPKKNKEHNHG